MLTFFKKYYNFYTFVDIPLPPNYNLYCKMQTLRNNFTNILRPVVLVKMTDWWWGLSQVLDVLKTKISRAKTEDFEIDCEDQKQRPIVLINSKLNKRLACFGPC